ncbi:hypothetical protein CD175_29645 [Pseudomonas laurylsulfatiphila]|uniref:Uncharacterized protein n=1 Tax=Pseudomonas laurylsulfatiphila TaxID=2011015 RepID=A0A2S6FD05_9PSED|nr:hypothetical protein CD175_29645 [Pseudomonas laurylsulfatiphila]
MLAMIVNDNAGLLFKRVAMTFFASKLAPTVICVLVRFLLESGNAVTRRVSVGKTDAAEAGQFGPQG